jgi:hypothetical protein
LKRGTSELTRTPLARVGRRKKKKAPARRDVVANVNARDVSCRFWFTAKSYIGPHDHTLHLLAPECGGHADVHEIIPRSIWPDGDLDMENCILLCRQHHIWIDSNRDLAEEIGLYSRGTTTR